ncbi:hypothetical protein [Paenibacillus bouchesdurhonensis]|uniref:hypothetical protein n=1 Tax=Paenibacillus bouchesdurhonensis TaxID=1870990 RepID=UPI001F27E7B0|nr:hypothetical protein [Paenibacillus bouchesdurhonensis]
MSEQKLDLILKELGSINGRMDGIDQRLDGIDKRLDGIDKRLDGIDKRLDGIDQRLDSHEGLITQLIGVVKSTNEKVTVMQEDLAELKEGQGRQDRILESLALHSLEQETIIRELKRIK